MKEIDLAKKVIDYLKQENWEVYQEVSLSRYHGGIADIYAVRNITWIIETKTSLSMALLEQAYDRKKFAHYVSIAIPSSKRSSKGRSFAQRVCKLYGIGVIEVKKRGGIYIPVDPKLFRKPSLPTLHEEQKDYAEAGGKGGYFTPFKRTVSNLNSIVAANPGIKFKDMMKELEHHYASDNTARSSIMKWIKHGVIDSVEIKREGKAVHLHPKNIGDKDED
jgi:hypothetical protein